MWGSLKRMGGRQSLEDYLRGQDRVDASVRATLLALAGACADIAYRVARGSLAGDANALVGLTPEGDEQHELDVWTNVQILAALRAAPVAAVVSEELDAPVLLSETAPLLVAVDPLDGSSNIDTNVSIGTIFAIFPAAPGPTTAASFLRPGTDQCAAGYALYGPQCTFVMTLGAGVQMFTLDPDTRRFVLTADSFTIPHVSKEYAVNASNYRHWSPGMCAFVDDCIAGAAGPRGVDFNTRWIASVVAECHRILGRGGLYLYPCDSRRGYEHGRLRLLYECFPLAFLVEQAGGAAIDGRTRILDLVPDAIHARAPFIFGSADEVARVGRYKIEDTETLQRSPLFGTRGLLRV